MGNRLSTKTARAATTTAPSGPFVVEHAGNGTYLLVDEGRGDRSARAITDYAHLLDIAAKATSAGTKGRAIASAAIGDDWTTKPW